MWFWLIREALKSFNVSPAAVTGGETVEGTLTLSDSAPANGALVHFESSNHDLVPVPEPQRIPGGQTTKPFRFSTNNFHTAGFFDVDITAWYAGVSIVDILRVETTGGTRRLPPLRVAHVWLLDMSDVPDRPNVDSLVNIENPRVALRLERGRANAIEIQFTNAHVSVEMVRPGETFIVLQEDRPVDGDIF